MSKRFSTAAINEMVREIKNPTTPAEENRHILQLQRKVAAQQKLIDDLSSALTHINQRLYGINDKLHRIDQKLPKE